MTERIGKSREVKGKPHITRSYGQWTVVAKGWRWYTKDFDRACAIAGWCRRSMYSALKRP